MILYSPITSFNQLFNRGPQLIRLYAADLFEDDFAFLIVKKSRR